MARAPHFLTIELESRGLRPEDITDLSVEILFLKGKGIQRIPEWMAELKGIQKLVIEQTSITMIPSFLFEYPLLSYLSLQRNHICQLPPIGENQMIETLHLGHNHIVRLPDSFWGLQSLKVLSLQNNALFCLPDLRRAEGMELERINLDNNFFIDYPKQLNDMETLAHVSIDNNHLPKCQSFGA